MSEMLHYARYGLNVILESRCSGRGVFKIDLKGRMVNVRKEFSAEFCGGLRGMRGIEDGG